jgi:16S rRNA (cytosine1402-N4)-methyltransferase
VGSHFEHHPVLVSKALALLNPGSGGVIVDGTVGGGGHAVAILEFTAPAGLLVALDRDEEALAAARQRLEPFGARVRLIHASFRSLAEVLAKLGIARVDGVLLDLGVSSPQLDRPERGFRFAADSAGETPLDMRMDRSAPTTAADLLATLSAEQLERCFRDYGELPGARKLARAIVKTRRRAPLRSAADLLALIAETRVGGGRRHHPGTLVFQALRIAVNDEIQALEEGLEAAIEALRPGCRLVVIAYHSLEDRIVKNRFRDAAKGCNCPPSSPVCICNGKKRLRVLTKRPVQSDAEETRANPRARSARLRAAERIAEAA